MLHALSAPNGLGSEKLPPLPTPPHFPPRPSSDEPGTRYTSGSYTRDNRLQPGFSPAVRPRASSSPPSPISPSISTSSDRVRSENGGSTQQCAGMTKKGERCTRMVKASPPLNYVDPDAPVERFCFQHEKEVMEPSGFYSRKGERIFVKFEGNYLLFLLK